MDGSQVLRFTFLSDWGTSWGEGSRLSRLFEPLN